MRYYTSLGRSSGVSMPLWFYVFVVLPCELLIYLVWIMAVVVATGLVAAGALLARLGPPASRGFVALWHRAVRGQLNTETARRD